MRTRPIAAIAGLLIALFALAACSGSPSATSPAGTDPGSTGSPASQAPSAGSPIDLSQIDVCALVGTGVAEALTGESGFDADGSSTASSAKCFWGVPRQGVPQYLEVQVERRTASLQGYGISPNGVACPGTPVPGVGVEAVGAVCSGDQTKVWLAAMDNGVFVQVLVNQPKGSLTPADLAAAANAILAGLG